MHSITHHNVDGLLEGDLILSPAGRWETVTAVHEIPNYWHLREICTTWGPLEKPARWRVSCTQNVTVSRHGLTAVVALFDFPSVHSSGYLAVGVDTSGRGEFGNPVVIVAMATARHGEGWAVLDAYSPKPAGEPTIAAEGLTKAKARTHLKALGRTFATTHGLKHDLANIRTS